MKMVHEALGTRSSTPSNHKEGRSMTNSWLVKGMLAVAIAVPALSGVARAGGTDDFGCSNATLKGEYAFGVTTYAAPTARMLWQASRFSTAMATSRSVITKATDFAGPDFAPPGQEKGTYTVNSDCTGSMVINLNAPVTSGSTGVINIMFVISDGGRHIHEVVSEFTPPGSSGTPAHSN